MKTQARAAVYVRVSTSEQNTDAQEAELKQYARQRGWTVFKIYRDIGQSGTKTKRPGLDELMSDCKRRKVDVVLVWKFDRFARSLKQLIDALQDFGERGIDFVSATEQIDTTTASGRCFFQIVGAIAEFERSLICERVKAGLMHARICGKRLGRPPLHRLHPKEAEQLKAEKTLRGVSLRSLARKYGVSLWMAHQLCKAG